MADSAGRLGGPDAARLLERVRERKAIPFVGAGISHAVLKGWDELLDALWRRLAVPGDRRSFQEAMQAEALRLRCPRGLVDEVLAHYGAALAHGPWRPHALVALGPWPAIVTTNWDEMIERAWADAVEAGGEDAAWFHAATRDGPQLPVRYRRDAQRFFAELRAGLRPPRLLKIHGDFQPAGRAEFVLGHADFRRVSARDVDLRALFQYLATDYSLLFYGTSLKDPDVLGFLDELRECLGPDVGPHYWLLAEDWITDEHVRLLADAYGIRALRCGDYAEAEELLARLVHEGLGSSGELARAEYQVHGVRVAVGAAPPRGAAAPPASFEAALASLGAAYAAGARHITLPVPAREVEALNGLLMALGRFAAGHRGAAMEVVLEVARPRARCRALFGDEAAATVSPGDLLTEVAEGRVKPGLTLSRSARGLVGCTVVWPMAPDGDGRSRLSVRHVVVPLASTVAQLAGSLGIGTLDPARACLRVSRSTAGSSPGGRESLLELGVTDAAVVALHIRWRDEDPRAADGEVI